jgi:hypothetical protein
MIWSAERRRWVQQISSINERINAERPHAWPRAKTTKRSMPDPSSPGASSLVCRPGPRGRGLLFTDMDR